eukprot:CAMPEP_0113919986 /NCGR_PEP_ID=MMETSP1159-20121227/308_1 /TAXON_ID=88271 /ORGANISM="Picocystis salinarum" /LENGTH=105 /DNA_ID=CAMNT_0000919937 /DNA_START=17 /DNA_END=331 /DNA_ORIENTATION=- /assembly_acc=CAM_ASM_000767
MEFNPTPYRGDPSIPHVNEELFKVILVGVNVATAWTMGSGRITTLGSEVQPRRFFPDYLLAVCDENARKREMKNGKVPRWFVPHPNPTNKSLPKMWDNFLNRKRW